MALIDHEQYYDVKRASWNPIKKYNEAVERMAKLKQPDRRPVREFKYGDIVNIKSKKPALSTGIVVGTITFPNLFKEPAALQHVKVIMAISEEELYSKVRDFIKRQFYSEDWSHLSLMYVNNQLEFVRECPPEWIEPLSSSEIHTFRFTDLMKEIEDGPKFGED